MSVKALVECTDKIVLATATALGGLTFLLPSALSTYMYLTKWIPEEPDPAKRNLMLAVFGLSVLGGIGVIGGAIYYLKSEKCIL